MIVNSGIAQMLSVENFRNCEIKESQSVPTTPLPTRITDATGTVKISLTTIFQLQLKELTFDLSLFFVCR